MKKIFSVILAIICVFGVLSTVAPLTVNAEENVLVIMQGKVDKEIGDKGSEVMLTIMNTETRERQEVMFYCTSNYRTKVEIPLGTYKIVSLYVSGTIEDFDFSRTTFEAKGQTVNVDFTVGNGDWSGNTDNAEINGTIDRDKTNELLEEKDKGTVDWDAVDKEVENIQEEVAEITTDEKQDATTTEKEVITETPEKTTKDKEENSKSLLLTIIFVVVVLGGSFGFIIWKRHKQGIPFGFSEE